MSCLSNKSLESIAAGAESMTADVVAHLDTCQACRVTLSELAADTPTGPDHLGRFEIIEQIGVGATGIVFLAFDPDLERNVAIKMLRDAGGAEALRQEAVALAKVQHPNLVAVYEVNEHEGDVYLVMEYLEGQSLPRWLATNPTVAEKRVAIASVCAGVTTLHDAGLLHRDIKPNNIIVRKDGSAVLTDFGFAGQATLARANQPQDIDALASRGSGTPAYMSPERLAGEPASEASDQYALALTIAEIVAETSASPRELAAQILEKKVDSRIVATAALRRGLSARPADRFDSVDALAERLLRARRWPKRLALAASVGGVAAALLFLPGALQAEESDECAQAAQRAARVWNDRSAARVSDIMQSQHVDAAAATARGFAGGAKRYLVQWEQATCTNAANPQLTSSRRRRTRQCLHSQLAAFESLVAGVGSMERKQLARLPKAMRSFPTPDACAYEGGPQLTKEEQTLAREVDALAIRHKLDDPAESLLTEAKDALARAEQMQSPQVVGRAMLLVGQLEAKRGIAGGRERFHQAAMAFARSGDDDGMARVWLAAANSSLVLREKEQTADLIRNAEALVEKLGRPRHLQHQLLGVKGTALLYQGKYTEAAALTEQALALVKDDPVRRGAIMFNLALSLYKATKYDRAEKIAAQALADAESLYGPVHPDIIRLVGLLGAIHQELGKLEFAEAELSRAVEVGEQIYTKRDSFLLATAYANLAAFYSDLRRVDEAVPLQRKSVEITLAITGGKGGQAAHLLTNLGLVEIGAGKYDEGRKTLEHALRVFAEAGQEKSLVAGHANLGLARVHANANNFQAAHSSWQTAYDILSTLIGPTHPMMGQVLARRAEIYSVERRFGKCVDDVSRAIPILAKPSDKAAGLIELYGFSTVCAHLAGRKRKAVEWARMVERLTGNEDNPVFSRAAMEAAIVLRSAGKSVPKRWQGHTKRALCQKHGLSDLCRSDL